MTERKTSLWTKILIISISILILMSIFANALVIGERLREKCNKYEMPIMDMKIQIKLKNYLIIVML